MIIIIISFIFSIDLFILIIHLQPRVHEIPNIPTNRKQTHISSNNLPNVIQSSQKLLRSSETSLSKISSHAGINTDNLKYSNIAFSN